MRKRSCQTKKYRLNDTQRALVEKNYSLVPYTVSRCFCVPQRDMEDVLQIGAIGLCRAAYEYDPERQCSFSTFAVRCICSHVRHYFHFLHKDCRDLRREVLILDAPINSENNVDCIVDYLPDEAVDVETEVYGQVEVEQLRSEIDNMPLTDRERNVIDRYLMGQTQRQIAKELGVTHSYVGQALNNARRKLLCNRQKDEPMMRDNPEFPPLAVFVVYNPETREYLTGRSNHNVYWSKDERHAKHYRDKRCALRARRDIEREWSGKTEVRRMKDKR